MEKAGLKYSMVFLMLFLSTSFVVTNDIVSSVLTIALWIVVMLGILYISQFRIEISVFCITIFTSIWIFGTSLINGENIISNSKSVFGIIAAGILASSLNFDEYAKIFIKVMKFLMIVSLVGYVLHLIIPGLFYLITVTNRSGEVFSNWILYIQNLYNSSGVYRNYGYAWEPGAFSTFICLAMMLEVFLPTTNLTFKSLMLYLITVLTTFSTTGITAAIILTVYLLMTNNGLSNNEKKIVFVSMLFMVVVMFGLQGVLFDRTKNSAFGKLINYSKGRSGSTSVRVNSVTKVFMAIFRRPLFGWGYDGLNRELYEYTYNMNTCTFLNWFAVYGIPFGCVMIVGILKFVSLFSAKRLNQIFMLFYMFLITISENYVNTPIIFLMIFVGYKLESAPLRIFEGGGELSHSFSLILEYKEIQEEK